MPQRPFQDFGAKGDGTYGEIKDTSLRIATPKSVPRLLKIDLNPRVSIPAFLIIWGFIFWCMFYDDANADMAEARAWITDNFTWLYVGSQDVWALFMIVLYFSKYGKLKLGKDDESPLYPSVTWFSMLFACGTGVGMLYYGVAEAIFHYTGKNRYTADPYRPDNLVAQDAINLVLFHWGIHGWVCYSLIGCLVALMVYRHGLPMKMSSCFYPLLGDKIFGWVGDCVDILSIVTTLFGVCTSLGLGVIQFNAGLHILNEDIKEEDWVRVIIVWGITIIATTSTVSGVDIGIRRLSEISFGLSVTLIALISLLHNPVYLLNVFVQSLGYYLQWFIQLGFHCDAFEMHSASKMGTDRYREVDSGTDGPDSWMDGWTIFYWGWWIAWCPFVGIFIAKISRGRTIREFINGTMTAPCLYTFLWFCVFGGTGIGVEREAAEAGYCCTQTFLNQSTITTPWSNDSSTLLVAADFTNYCVASGCNECAENTLNHAVAQGMTRMQTYDWLTDGDSNKFARSENKDFVRLSCYSLDEMWFYTMETNADLGKFLDIVSLAAIVLYFITSSDSGSYIIDMLGSNGDQDPPTLQRIFWALTEGAAATALLIAGGDEALNALQTVSIVCGLPYTIIVCLLCVALWRACKVSMGDLDPKADDFSVGYLDFATEFKSDIILEWLLSWLLGPFWAAKAACKVWHFREYMVYMFAIVCYGLLLGFVLFHFLHLAASDLWALAWVCYFAFAGIIGVMRSAVREAHGYIGNPIEDFFAALFLYPSVGQQLRRADDKSVKPMNQNGHHAAHDNRKNDIEMEPPQYGMVQQQQQQQEYGMDQ